MRVLITGIDGFVGSHAADLLVAEGAEVHGTILRFDELRNIAHLKSSLTLHQADITNPGRVDELVQTIRPERILHIAGQAFVPASMSNPMQTFQVNLIGGLSILDAARKTKTATGTSPAVLVVTSGETYGRVAPDRLPITEDHPFSPTTPYAASKAALDIIALQYASSFGVEVIVVRPFNHAGPRQSPSFVVSDFARQFAEISLQKRRPVLHVGNITAKRDFTDVRDVVKAYWKLFDKQSDHTAFNVCSGHSVEIREVLAMLREASGLQVEIVQEQQRVRPYDVAVVSASYSRLHAATGWKPEIPLSTTIADTYTYWMNELRSTESGVAAPR